MDDNAIDIKNTIEMGIEEIEQIESERNPATRHVIPGQKIASLINKWD